MLRHNSSQPWFHSGSLVGPANEGSVLLFSTRYYAVKLLKVLSLRHFAKYPFNKLNSKHKIRYAVAHIGALAFGMLSFTTIKLKTVKQHLGLHSRFGSGQSCRAATTRGGACLDVSRFFALAVTCRQLSLASCLLDTHNDNHAMPRGN